MAGNRVFIGDPFDPDFDWRGTRPGKAEPRAVSELPATSRLWEALGRRFEGGQLAARRTPGAGWIGLATRRELLTLVDEAGLAGEPSLPALRQAVGRLDDKTMYYVVARPEGAAATERDPTSGAED
jgi:hypothetical protein